MYSVDIIDMEATAALFGHDTAIARHLYTLLKETLEADHRQLIQSCEQQQWETAKSWSHRIQGALRYCKVPNYHQALMAVEQALQEGCLSSAHLLALDEAYHALHQALHDGFSGK